MLASVRSKLRGRMFGLLLLSTACSACAAGTAETRPARAAENGPLYDAAAEWAAQNSGSTTASAPLSRRRLRPLPLRALPAPPEYRLRGFSLAEVERIQSVQSFVRSASQAHDVPPDLVNGIIWVESRFQVRARSARNACGLMQLLPSTGREVARSLGRRYAPFDPEFNIHAGTFYFARLVERFGGNLALALAAYNIGPAVVTGWMRAASPLPSQSRAYVHSVYAAAQSFHVLEL